MIRERLLKVLLVLVGLLFLMAAYPLTRLSQPEIGEQMLGGVYGTLGVFLLLAFRNPSAHRSLIAFTAWSSLAHAAVMAVQATHNLIPPGDLLTAVLPLAMIGLALIALAPKRGPNPQPWQEQASETRA